MTTSTASRADLLVEPRHTEANAPSPDGLVELSEDEYEEIGDDLLGAAAADEGVGAGEDMEHFSNAELDRLANDLFRAELDAIRQAAGRPDEDDVLDPTWDGVEDGRLRPILMTFKDLAERRGPSPLVALMDGGGHAAVVVDVEPKVATLLLDGGYGILDAEDFALEDPPDLTQHLFVGEEITVMVLELYRGRYAARVGVKQLITGDLEQRLPIWARRKQASKGPVPRREPLRSEPRPRPRLPDAPPWGAARRLSMEPFQVFVLQVESDGAVVQLQGGETSFLPLNEMAWLVPYGIHATDLVRRGAELTVVWLSRVSTRFVSRKRTTPDPWPDILPRFPIGMQIEGIVVAYTPNGLLVEIEPGLLGRVGPDGPARWASTALHKLHRVGDRIVVEVVHHRLVAQGPRFIFNVVHGAAAADKTPTAEASSGED